MNRHDVFMCVFGWYFRWKTRRDYIKAMDLRSRDEILNKKFEWEMKLLDAEKQQREADFLKFEHYLNVLRWVLKQ